MEHFKHSFSRRNLFRIGATIGAGVLLPQMLHAKELQAENIHGINDNAENETGSQRLSVEKLKQWESLGYGMFIHFGMSTYDGDELSSGDKPASFYNPDKLDVDQWIGVARDAGTKYAVLTFLHLIFDCLFRFLHYH